VKTFFVIGEVQGLTGQQTKNSTLNHLIIQLSTFNFHPDRTNVQTSTSAENFQKKKLPAAGQWEPCWNPIFSFVLVVLAVFLPITFFLNF